MISNNLSLVEHQKNKAESLAEQVAKFVASGGRVTEVEGPAPELHPPRSTWVDPDAILKRKPVRMTLAERRALRKMADSI